MSSIISGYSYDIFISYRQKDNKGDKWVSNFVESLKTELDSTFKEDISVYFDINPHDGLLGTHDVDASLKEKLKCLIFIPVISRTYCDPNSFAWQHEFKAFVEQTSKDQYGLKVKLPTGNVAGRVLPVIIHDLDNNDVKLCESVIGGNLRGIDFVYSEPGVNRPLSPSDQTDINLGRTNYRNQINKVANAIKEIISGLRLTDDNESEKNKDNAIGDWTETEGKSIAVLPFVDMSPEKDQEYFCDGITEEIINVLCHTEDFKVISRTSSFAFKGKNVDVREIGRILNVKTLLEGSIRKSGEQLRITAQLIKVVDGSHIWSERYDRELKDVFAIQDEISASIVSNLKVKLLGEKKIKIAKQHSENLEAFNLYLKGTFSSRMFTREGFDKATEYFEKAITIDPDYALPYVGLAEVLAFRSYWGNYKPSEALPMAKQYIEKALSADDTLAEAYSLMGNICLFYNWNTDESEKNFRHALQLNPNSSMIHIDFGIFLRLTGRNEEAITEALKAKELDPLSWYINSRSGDVFNAAGQVEKAIEEYRMSISINPDYFLTHFQLGLVYFRKKMILKAVAELEKAYKLSDGNPIISATLYAAFFRMLRRGKARKILEDLENRNEIEYIPPSCFFIISNIRGEKEKAMDWLRKGLRERDTMLPDIRLSMLNAPGGIKYINLMKEMGMNFDNHSDARG